MNQYMKNSSSFFLSSLSSFLSFHLFLFPSLSNTVNEYLIKHLINMAGPILGLEGFPNTLKSWEKMLLQVCRFLAWWGKVRQNSDLRVVSWDFSRRQEEENLSCLCQEFRFFCGMDLIIRVEANFLSWIFSALKSFLLLLIILCFRLGVISSEQTLLTTCFSSCLSIIAISTCYGVKTQHCPWTITPREWSNDLFCLLF